MSHAPRSRRLVTSCLAAAIALTPALRAASQALENCAQGRVIHAQEATLTPATVRTRPGVLFSDAGFFAAHGADEPCDPGKSLGPFEVDAAGELVLRITGGPAVEAVWSLGNSGTGVTVYFEPKVGAGYGPADLIVAAALGVGQTKTEMGGSWGGPGRISAYVHAPKGSGPLTGSCFEQSYATAAEIVSVATAHSLLPGYVIQPGDRISTGVNGRVVINNDLIEIAPMSQAEFWPGEPDVQSGTIDLGPDPKLIKRFQLMDRLGKLQAAGYPKPDRPDLMSYNDGTLDALVERLSTEPDPCKVAVLAKLFLDSRQDEFTEMTAAAIGLEILAIKTIPNNWKIADILLRRALKHSIPGLQQAAVAEDVLSVYDVVDRYMAGTGAGRRGRWGLAIFETATAEGWSPARIEQERRDRQVTMETRNAQIHALSDQMRLDGLQLEQEYLARETEIKSWLRQRLSEIAADEEAQGETTRREAWLKANPQYARPGVWYRPGEEIADREPLSHARQRYLSEAAGYYIQARQGAHLAAALQGGVAFASYKVDLGVMSWTFNRAISEKLTDMARLQAESHVLNDFVAPVNGQQCEKLRKPAPSAPECRKQIELLAGWLTFDRPELPAPLEAILPSGTPDANTRSPVLGHSLISIIVNKVVAFPRGTRFTVGNTHDGGVIRVSEGAVSVRHADGRVRLVGPGQQITTEDMYVSSMTDPPAAPLQLNGVPLGDTLTVGEADQAYGRYPLVLRESVPGNGWQWRDPGNDATLTAAADGAIVATVPDGNEIWAGRADGPRLLHKASGDFDLDLSLNLSVPGGANHFAITEFVLYAPGGQLGTLSGQASGMTAPGADLRLLNGAWSRFNGASTLPVLNEDHGVTPSDDAMVQLRLSRRGNLFFSQWSLDGDHWTLGTREQIDAPETLWAGLAFKRIAHDGQSDVPAVSTLRDMVLTSTYSGAFVDPPMLTIQGAGTVTPLLEGWEMEQSPDIAGSLAATSTDPITGDFDVVLRVDFGTAAADPSASLAAGLMLNGTTKGDWAYVALSVGSPHGGRYQTHQGRDGTAGRYVWADTSDRFGWVRLTRLDGVVRARFWRLGRWEDLPEPGIRLDGPLFFGVRSWNTWHDQPPAALNAWLAIERIAFGAEAADTYQPKGYALMTPAPLPDLDLPRGVTAALYTAPFAMQAPFFDAQGNLYLLPADHAERKLIRLSPDGAASLAAEGEVFAGLNRKRGLWHDGTLLVNVDGWGEGGNSLSGLFRVAADGKAVRIDVSEGLGGSSCLRALQDGRVLQCDFENDGLWVGDAHGGALENLSGPGLACPQDAAESRATGMIFAVNNGASYSCNGEPGLFRVPAGGGAPALVLRPAGPLDFGGVVWTTGGMFGRGLLLVDPNRGALLRVDEGSGNAVPVLAGLDRPADLAARPDGSALAVMLGDGQVLLLHGATPEPQPIVAPVAKVPVPKHSSGKAPSDLPDPETAPVVAQPPAPAPPLTAPPVPAPPPDVVVVVPPPIVDPGPVWEPYGPIVTASIDTIAAVRNGPTQLSHFRIAEPMMVVSIMTYHWNFGRGDMTGTIGLVDEAGDLVGRWAAEGSDGQGGVPNAYWHVYPGLVLAPGLYRIIDAKPETWSTNAETGNRGIFRVELQRVRDSAVGR